MMILSRNTKILIALLFLLATLVFYRLATKEELKRVKELTYKPGTRSYKSGSGTEGKVIVPLQPGETLLESESQKTGKKRPYKGVIRNPFQALYPPPPPPPAVITKPAPLPVPVPFPVITTRAPSSAQIESGKFKFLGFLQKEGDKKIFLSKEKEVFIVKKGDSIGMFQVSDISENSVTLTSRNSNEEFRLTIEEMKPTKPGIAPGGGRR